MPSHALLVYRAALRVVEVRWWRKCEESRFVVVLLLLPLAFGECLHLPLGDRRFWREESTNSTRGCTCRAKLHVWHVIMHVILCSHARREACFTASATYCLI